VTDTPERVSSAERSRAFYRALGATGLAIRTKPDWDRRAVDDLRGLIPATGRVLDVGCGYGRIAVPLAELGYDVTGIDIAPNLIRSARRRAAERGLRARFDEGSMTAMPYGDATFDIVISVWSAFYELLEHAEQVAALREMRRVLRAPAGIGIVDGPLYAPATPADIDSGRRHGPANRLVLDEISGHRAEHFAHDRDSLLGIAADAGVASGRVIERDWGGRPRQLLMFTSGAP
jgi:ubiquinone/menaquinone biosynthesis C-methylase UbiE